MKKTGGKIEQLHTSLWPYFERNCNTDRSELFLIYTIEVCMVILEPVWHKWTKERTIFHNVYCTLFHICWTLNILFFLITVQERPHSVLPLCEVVCHHGPHVGIRIYSSFCTFAVSVVPIHSLQWITRSLHLCHVWYEKKHCLHVMGQIHQSAWISTSRYVYKNWRRNILLLIYCKVKEVTNVYRPPPTTTLSLVLFVNNPTCRRSSTITQTSLIFG